MKKLHVIKSLIALSLIAGFFIACDNEDSSPSLAGFEVSGSLYPGIYRTEEGSNGETRYVNEDNNSAYLKTFNAGKNEMWGLFVKRPSSSTTIYYMAKCDGEYPPESGWKCGGGIDKPRFKVTPVYE